MSYLFVKWILRLKSQQTLLINRIGFDQFMHEWRSKWQKLQHNDRKIMLISPDNYIIYKVSNLFQQK